ncbi:hypothetical protein Tco_0626150 [Tanacetum coccineum]|uniref:Uncharacterized protein n=1 Tax=Tanacetum coccineum TaxID=301880 RepID=A0ABQ4WIT8_9ASTR
MIACPLDANAFRDDAGEPRDVADVLKDAAMFLKMLPEPEKSRCNGQVVCNMRVKNSVVHMVVYDVET